MRVIQDLDVFAKRIEVEKIRDILRKNTIDKYATNCDCGFVFVAMTHWVKEGSKFCNCGECGEVNLLD